MFDGPATLVSKYRLRVGYEVEIEATNDWAAHRIAGAIQREQLEGVDKATSAAQRTAITGFDLRERHGVDDSQSRVLRSRSRHLMLRGDRIHSWLADVATAGFVVAAIVYPIWWMVLCAAIQCLRRGRDIVREVLAEKVTP